MHKQKWSSQIQQEQWISTRFTEYENQSRDCNTNIHKISWWLRHIGREVWGTFVKSNFISILRIKSRGIQWERLCQKVDDVCSITVWMEGWTTKVSKWLDSIQLISIQRHVKLHTNNCILFCIMWIHVTEVQQLKKNKPLFTHEKQCWWYDKGKQ